MQAVIQPEDDEEGEAPVESGSPAEEIYETAQGLFEQAGVYLSGPIMNSPDNGVGWREDIIDDYGNEFTFHNPLDAYDPIESQILNDPLDFDPESDQEQILPSEYVTEDKLMISRSDCLFVGLSEVIARGTLLECGFAKWAIGIPFFVWAMEGQQESGWIYDNAAFLSTDRDEVVEEMRWYLHEQ